MRPKFTHDCPACKFIGRLDGHDCYRHETPTQVTFVKRWGDAGPEYGSRSYLRRGDKPDGDWAILARMGDN